MGKTVLLLMLVIIVAALLSGCGSVPNENDSDFSREAAEYLNGIGYAVYNTADEPPGETNDPRDTLPEEAREYLSELGGMEYAGEFGITIDGEKDVIDFHNDYIPPAGYKAAEAEWKLGSLSSLFPLLFKEDFLANNMTAQHNSDLLDVLVYNGRYNVYVYTSDENDLTCKVRKGCMIIIEKWTDPGESPNMHIWSYARVYGISRPGLLMPSDEKVYEYYKEFGERK